MTDFPTHAAALRRAMRRDGSVPPIELDEPQQRTRRVNVVVVCLIVCGAIVGGIAAARGAQEGLQEPDERRWEITIVYPGRMYDQVRATHQKLGDWTYDSKTECQIAIRTVRVADGVRLLCLPTEQWRVR